MALDPVILSAIAGLVVGLIAGILGALYTPLLNEWVQNRAQKKKLRLGLFRELVHWYENIIWRIKQFDRAYCELGFFQHPPPGEIPLTHSVIQAEHYPQLGRRDLKEKVRILRRHFSDLDTELRQNNLYGQTLKDNEVMRYFYQLHESEVITSCYDDFRYAFEYELPTYFSVPHSRFLSPKEARELTLLEARLDYLRSICETVVLHEKHGELDTNLLTKMRRGKKRGTVINNPKTGRETSRWCLACETFSDPMIFWAVSDPAMFWLLNRALVNELCEHCGSKLPTVKEWSNDLTKDDDGKRKIAAEALAKTFEYNRVDLQRENVDRLVEALSDKLAKVRENASLALGNIGKRLEVLDAPRDKNAYADNEGNTAHVEDIAVEALAQRLIKVKENVNVRRAAAQAIGKIYKSREGGAGVAHSALKVALQSSNDDIKAAAATAVGNINDEDLFKSLEASLSSASSETGQAEIVSALGLFGKKSVEGLVQILQDDQKPKIVRGRAAFVLGSIADLSEVWEPLQQIARDKSADFSLRFSATHALKLLQD
jgi:uncharacterized protein (UPF0147 family)